MLHTLTADYELCACPCQIGSSMRNGWGCEVLVQRSGMAKGISCHGNRALQLLSGCWG